MLEEYALIAIAIVAGWIAFRFLFPKLAIEDRLKSASEDFNSTEDLQQNETEESP